VTNKAAVDSSSFNIKPKQIKIKLGSSWGTEVRAELLLKEWFRHTNSWEIFLSKIMMFDHAYLSYTKTNPFYDILKEK